MDHQAFCSIGPPRLTCDSGAPTLSAMKKSTSPGAGLFGASVVCLLLGACSSPAAKACRQLSVLCGAELSRDELRDCAETLNAASQETQTDVGKQLLRCTDSADSCAEAVGCAVGTGANVVASLVEKFSQGFHRGATGERVTNHITRSHRSITHERHEEYHEEHSEESREQQTVVRSDEPSGERPAVRYLSVSARPGIDAFGNHLIVSIELETLTDMPLIAPRLKVNALCGAQTETQEAFSHDLSEARRADRKVDTIKLFRSGLTAPIDRCELTLSLTQGATPPQWFCLQQGTTRPGRCS